MNLVSGVYIVKKRPAFSFASVVFYALALVGSLGLLVLVFLCCNLLLHVLAFVDKSYVLRYTFVVKIMYVL